MLQFHKILSTPQQCEWGALHYDLFFSLRYDYAPKAWRMTISRYVAESQCEILSTYQMPKVDALAHLGRND